MKDIDPKALFRLSVLGPLVSREHLSRGELQRIVRHLAEQHYAIPGSGRVRIAEKTIEAWYYAWRREGIAGLIPKTRADRGCSKLTHELQEAILAAKRENPRRSIRQIRQLLEAAGQVARGSLSRSAIHRLLQQQGLSRLSGSSSEPQERRSFVANEACAIWYGDVMHGPTLTLTGGRRKTYLVTLFDDASRLVAHSAFCLGETALDIEGVLKQALLRRGLPRKLVVDNGAAYRAATLQGVCARLGVVLIHCRPYAPEGKGKLERWHRTFRDQFLSELDVRHLRDLADLNARLWAWIEEVYHRAPHGGLNGITPLARYQQDLQKIRTLGAQATQLDALFYHRLTRFVRKDGTVAYDGRRFEVPFELSGKTVSLLVDPHPRTVIGVEDKDGNSLGFATALDAIANQQRPRRKPLAATPAAEPRGAVCSNLIELAHQQYHGKQED